MKLKFFGMEFDPLVLVSENIDNLNDADYLELRNGFIQIVHDQDKKRIQAVNNVQPTPEEIPDECE
ncbi:hypothetical protein MmiEs2_09040 [Methanimicrococcus stummii]|uniref:Uncharacterized protein n=1 Tax=Methanimicrococcus stummii TaxID=3028294 RepID=A0AA96ZYC5_9EURY|nr:hypothetical protein [Methanimicrococcus sp. Es2]WNY28701.1 hypothetical protein MmiEs2_09040 [Methanimicrococcus sp. Es2]